MYLYPRCAFPVGCQRGWCRRFEDGSISVSRSPADHSISMGNK